MLALAVSTAPTVQVLEAEVEEVDEVEAAMPSSVAVCSAGCTTQLMTPEAMVAAVAVVVVVVVVGWCQECSNSKDKYSWPSVLF
jgi:hypothetical protein